MSDIATVDLSQVAQALYDPKQWSDLNSIHRTFSYLRENDPVHFVYRDGYPDFWHITKQEDIFEIERLTDVFLSSPRLIMMKCEDEEVIRARTGGSVNLIKSLITLDDPEHTPMRMITQGWFKQGRIATLRAMIERYADEALNKCELAGEFCEFVGDAAAFYPLQVIMALLGVPKSDHQQMLDWTKELFSPETSSPTEVHNKDTASNSRRQRSLYEDFSRYFLNLVEVCRNTPRDDLVSILASATIDGRKLDDQEILGYCIIVATAGHDTTTYALSEAVHQLAINPDVFSALKVDPAKNAPLVAEEAIRIASPTRHFVRTTNRDYELRGKNLKEGDSVVLWYPSGSRDEDVFSNPNVFDPFRAKKGRHASFGFGGHMCLGMHLARLEVAVFVELLARRVQAMNLSAPPTYTESNFVGGIVRLPLAMHF